MARSHNLGDTVWALEVEFVDGSTDVKLYPTRRGLESGLDAANADILRWKGHQATRHAGSWVPVATKVYEATPQWALKQHYHT